MSDRELLELAAKAAGYSFNQFYFNPQSGLLVWEPPTNYESRDWNPLTDDGDALRLAVKLRLAVSFDGSCATAAAMRVQGVYERPAVVEDSDHCAATRRAIVRAAAEIGRSIK